MDLQEARELARKKMKGCFVCPECDGKACKGMIPGFGGLRTAKTFLRNVEALAEYGLVMRSMDSAVDPNPAVTIFGKEISMPVLVAPVGGVILNSKVPGDPATVEMDYNESVSKGAFDAGTLCFTGDGGMEYMFESGIVASKNGKKQSFRRSNRAATTRSLKRLESLKRPMPLPLPAISMRRR